MKPIFKEVNSFDKKCYTNYDLTEDILMEHAAYEIALEIYKRAKPNSTITIVAGPGNNGADGITLARILLGDYDINLITPLGVKSDMAKKQLNRYFKIGGKVDKDISLNSTLIVDAIFGSGLKRDLDEKTILIIKKLNNMKSFKIACDIPTGLNENGIATPIAFKSDLTITMGAEKLALYSDEAKDYVGEIKVANLGVSFYKYIDKCCYFKLEKEDLKLPIRTKQNTHKRSYGHLGVLVGDKIGAGIIAASAALNFGSGLVSIVSRENIQIPYELMLTNKIENFSALAFGMGLNNHFDDELKNISQLNIPMVIDADMFYKNELLLFLQKNKIVLTPHPKEFQSLLKLTNLGEYSINEIQQNRIELAKEFSKKYPHIVLLLKGANKIIAFNEKIFIDPLGGVALAKGGSGDVLAGMIGSLLAQNHHPLKATINASLAHSLAGNYNPNYALTPMKIIKNLEKLI